MHSSLLENSLLVFCLVPIILMGASFQKLVVVLVFALESSTPNGHFLVHWFADYNQRNLFAILLQF